MFLIFGFIINKEILIWFGGSDKDELLIFYRLVVLLFFNGFVFNIVN